MSRIRLALLFTALLGLLHISAAAFTILADTPPRWVTLAMYHSYFSVASLLHKSGLPVIGEFREGMFMAPVTATGNSAISLTWLIIYFGLSYLIIFSFEKFWHRAKP